MVSPGFGAESALCQSSRHYHSHDSLSWVGPSENGWSVSFPSTTALNWGTSSFALAPAGGGTGGQSFLLSAGCPLGTTCCEFDPESRKCIGGCCSQASGCCPDGSPGVDDRCTDLRSDPANCGRCNHACPSGQRCLNGTCAGCPSGTTLCGKNCVDLSSDTQNCGTCGNFCPTPSNSSGVTCTNGVCGFGCNSSFTKCGNVCCSSTCTGTVASPPGGLGSFSNYFLDNGCLNILGAYVVVQIGQDLNSTTGFTIQLNADSPAGTEPDAAQQYGFSITGNSIQGFINNWTNATTAIACDSVDLCSTPINNGLPAGYALGLYLATDAGGNVTGATYQVYDNNGNQLANQFFAVDQAGCNCSLPQGFTCTGFQAGDLSPMTNFTVVIVGPGNGSAATFSSGAGVILYGSNGELTPLSFKPTCVETGLVTLETSNTTYGTLNGCPKPVLTQQFSITTASPPPPPPDCTTTGCPGGRYCCDCASPAVCTSKSWCLNHICKL